MDKELEVDEFLRSSVKDADQEKKVRELYEKAYGLDHVKPKYQEARDKLKSVEGKYSQMSESIQELGQFIQGNDFDSFFGALQVPLDKVYNWVAQKLQYQQLPPEQRQVHDREQQLRQQNYQLEKQARQSQSSLEQQAVQVRTREVMSVLDKPDVKSTAEAFDAYAASKGLKLPDGSPVTFYSEIVKRGQMAYYSSGEDLAPEAIAQELVSMYGSLVQPAPAGASTQAPAAVAAAPAATKPPVIPAIPGGSASPTKKAIRSLDDIRERANQMS